MQYVEVTYFLSGLVGDVKQQQQLYTSSLVDEILFPEVQYTYILCCYTCLYFHYKIIGYDLSYWWEVQTPICSISRCIHSKGIKHKYVCIILSVWSLFYNHYRLYLWKEQPNMCSWTHCHNYTNIKTVAIVCMHVSPH